MNDDCKRVRECLHDWVDAELTGADEAQVAEHIDNCDECCEQANGIRRLKKLVLVKAKKEPMPAGLEDRLRECLYEEMAMDTVRRPVWRSPRLLAAAALVAVSLAVTLIFNSGDAPYLAHAQTAQAVLSTHLEGPEGMRILSLDEALAVLSRRGLGTQLPPLSGDVRFIGLREKGFGSDGWCKSFQLCFQTGSGDTFSLIATPAEIRVDCKDMKTAKHWRPGCCLCVQVDAHSVMCFRQGGTHFWIVTDQKPDSFYDQHLASALRLRTGGVDTAEENKPR